MKTSEESLFLAAPFFMVRTPFFSADDYFSFVGNKGINILDSYAEEQKNQFLEALAIASPTLYQSITQKKSNKEFSGSILNYFSRMATRPTPFGLFSFVSVGKFDCSTKVYFDLDLVSKRARPDMEWVFKIIEQICSNESLLKHFSVKKNPLIYERGNRIFLDYFRKMAGNEETKKISIHVSLLTSTIFELAVTSINVEELLEQTVKHHPTLDRIKIFSIIKQLLNLQLLCFSLQPSLQTHSPFDDLIKKLSHIPYDSKPLVDIASKIALYNSTKIGEGITSLEEIKKKMMKLSSTSNFVQVDAYYPYNKITLSKRIAKELQTAVEVAWTITQSASAPSPLKTYHEKFLEKYGIHRTIPILELLNEEAGLGVPNTYLSTSQQYQRSFPVENKWNQWLKNEWIECIREKRSEIELSESILKTLLEKHNKLEAQVSFDLFCQIISNSSSKIDEGDFLINLSGNSNQAGDTFGRFLDLFNDSDKELLRSLYFKEESLEKNIQFAQCSYTPLNPRHANVAITSNLRPYTIDLEGNKNISLSHIYIGATLERFYLTQDFSHELIVTKGNMVNDKLAPIPIRFMLDVSSYKYKKISFLPWMDLENCSYLPRVRYKKFIFSAEQWILNYISLGYQNEEKFHDIKKRFLDWVCKWRIPRYCFFGTDDERLLIDLEHPIQLEGILRQLKNKKTITLVEKIGNQEWVSSERGTHFSEFIIPFIKNPIYSSQTKDIYIPPFTPIPHEIRFKLPGSEWIYLKFYMSEDQQNRFLIKEYDLFTKDLLKLGIIQQCFFVRYTDPDAHLRLRFKSDQTTMHPKLINCLHDWSTFLLKNRFIKEMNFSTYEREIERFGGEQLIDIAESLFCIDASTIISLMMSLNERKKELSEESLAAISLIDFLTKFGLDFNEQLLFFSQGISEKKALQGYREQKTALVSLTEALIQNKLHEHSSLGICLSDHFKKRKAVIEKYKEGIDKLANTGQFSISSYGIIDSVLHMHCNRLLGTDLRKEIKARLYAYQTLNVLNQKLNLII